ncbi:MAG: gamma-glutamyltranspeptidase / glutathione hydrolase [Solirubrobacteraceae bacterium]|nr:gamma-glutamyltranspeptidase / glutathione hydrolase [Solirubrobacteraceae bacterium]
MGQGPNSNRGVIAAGHACTVDVGADVLREGGNAVDAAVAAVAASFTAEPLLTGLGAGGYMLVTSPAGEATLLDFFVEAPGRGADPDQRAELVPVTVSFGDAVQIFNVGPASVGAYGMPRGLRDAVERFGSLPLAELLAPGARLARDGVVLTAEQAYVIEILAGIATSTPECAELFAPGGRLLREGDVFSNPELGDTLERLGREGAEPFYRGDIATAVVDHLAPRGSMLTREDLAAYEVVTRTPLRASYRGRDVLLNPPPSAGGVLIAFALSLLGRAPGPPTIAQTVDVMDAAQAERTSEFLDGLAEEGFLERFLSSRMGSTTHVSVLDVDGWACSVTSSNGEGCGIVVPGTGLHINNMMGEEDLNPLGFHHHPPGRRLPSMMAPTIVLAGERPELVLGSGGSNRIRSAILQTIINVLDRGMSADAAVRAPRVHFEDGIVYAEPGVDPDAVEGKDRAIARFRDLNLFFGGVHAVERDPRTGALSGGGDPRRGGASMVA